MRIRTAALIGLLLVLHLALLLAGFVAPYSPIAQNRQLSYAPPTKLHFRDYTGWHLRPFVYEWMIAPDGYVEDESRAYPVSLFVKGHSYKMLGLFDASLHLFGTTEPGKILLFGTDGFGRDEFSRVVYGGQISVAAGIVATLIALILGSTLGMIAGYYGRWLDEAVMGATELFLSLPWLYFLLGVRAFLPLHLSPLRTFFLLTCVVGLIGWAKPARLIRGLVLSIRSRNYVLAATGFGASNLYVVRGHIAPEVMGNLLTQAALLIPQYIAAEVTLSFFGLGVSEPLPSWGNMLSILQQYSVLTSYRWLMAPAGALLITSVTYYLLADALHSRLKSRST